MSQVPSRGQSLLTRLDQGDDGARAELMSSLYEQLRWMAHGLMSRQRRDHTLQATALVHEAFLRLEPSFEHKSPPRAVIALAASAMRSVLIDHARARATLRRDSARAHDVSLDELPEAASDGQSLLEVAEAIDTLERHDPDLARIAELRIFGGLEHQDIAQVVGCSERTSERRWRLARALLERSIELG